jgi:hypothetical protein
MSISLSIIIPTSDILLNKNYSSVYGSGSPLSCDDSFWSLVIYEFWDRLSIHNHLMGMIRSLLNDTLRAHNNMDFSKEIRENFYIRRKKINEGINIYNILSKKESLALISAIKILYDVNEKYDYDTSHLMT